MSRYRWLHAEWQQPIRMLAKRLKSKAFDNKNLEGFIVDRIRDDFVEARYIEKLDFSEVVTDPFGNEMRFERTEFRRCDFRISITEPRLELVNPPRSTQGLISRLAEASDFSLALSPLNLDVIAWAEAFQRIARVKAVVDSLQIGAVELESGISAKMLLKGSTDVREAMKSLTKGKRYVIEKMRLQLQGETKETLVLTKDGAARIESANQQNLASALRESIASKGVGL